jgi:hypothetical protein
MSWTYSKNPAASDLDEVRYLSGCISEDEQYTTDEEIDYAVAREGNNTAAAALVCEGLAAQFAREVQITAGADGELKLYFQQLSGAFAKRGKSLRAKAAVFAVPYAASVSVAEKEVQEEDDDRVTPMFSRDKFKNTGSVDKNILDFDKNGIRE